MKRWHPLVERVEGDRAGGSGRQCGGCVYGDNINFFNNLIECTRNVIQTLLNT